MHRPLQGSGQTLAWRAQRQGLSLHSRLAATLTAHVQAGHVVVGLEASCLLGLRDDALALGLGEPLREVSNQVFLLEELLAREVMAKRLNLPL